MAKKVSLYGILTAFALILSYVESLYSLAFIAPGIKLGLANTVGLFLISSGDTKGGFAVNICRVILANLLFGSPFSLLFSLTAAVMSSVSMIFFRRFKCFSNAGLGVIGASVHNITQLAVAAAVTGAAKVVLYSPFLLISAAVTGMITGWFANLISKRFRQTGNFVV